MADGDLVFDEDLDGSPIPKDDRVLPPTVETVTHDRAGNAHPVENIEPYVWVRAHHNLPGFLQAPNERGEREWLTIGRCGWMPNNEEGVQAVALGFAEIVDTPLDPPPMPNAPRPVAAVPEDPEFATGGVVPRPNW